MSCLKLYSPRQFALYRPAESDWDDHPAGDESPVILRFPRIAGRIRGDRQQDLLSRARLIHENRLCPECGRAAVVPVDDEAALMTRNHLPVPGTGRLIGFECDCCGHAWSAE